MQIKIYLILIIIYSALIPQSMIGSYWRTRACNRKFCVPTQSAYEINGTTRNSDRIYYAHPYWRAQYRYGLWYPQYPTCHDYAPDHPLAGTHRPWGGGWVY